ncbi:hypothetical protein SAY86_010017 [Trapa natans]|nr:hypothetical protein SAY86_010017 [Trapa natans]
MRAQTTMDIRQRRNNRANEQLHGFRRHDYMLFVTLDHTHARNPDQISIVSQSRAAGREMDSRNKDRSGS